MPKADMPKADMPKADMPKAEKKHFLELYKESHFILTEWINEILYLKI
jgi:hypothetical protein